MGRILSRAEQGETVIIKRHGREIAQIGPLDRSDAKLPSLASLRDRIANKGKALSKALIEQRKEARY